MKSDELGQLADNVHDWAAPSVTGKQSAITQAPQVTARMFPAGDVSMSQSTAYPAAMTANQAPMAPCLFSEAVVFRLACSAGTSSAARASMVSSHVCARPGWVIQLMIAPQKAATTITPVHDQK